MRAAILASVLFLAACGGTSTLPACKTSWALSVPDAAQSQCTAARALVQCDLGGGEGEVGLSDDPTRCSGGSPGKNQCADDEYGVACGSVGPSQAAAEPPAGCRSKFPTPGGVVFYCCPCM
jgi:hypothetical protein